MAREPHPGSLPITRPLQIQPPLLFDAAQQQHASSGPSKPSSSQPAAQLLNGIVPPPVVTEISPHCGKSSPLGAGAGAGYSAEAEAKEEPVARVSTRGEAPGRRSRGGSSTWALTVVAARRATKTARVRATMATKEGWVGRGEQSVCGLWANSRNLGGARSTAQCSLRAGVGERCTVRERLRMAAPRTAHRRALHACDRR